VLPKSKYYTAVGLVVDAALSRISRSILALPDITEEESHKLSELCRIFNSLEGLFVEDTAEASSGYS
jgi:centromere/kinetochore protein ZW10